MKGALGSTRLPEETFEEGDEKNMWYIKYRTDPMKAKDANFRRKVVIDVYLRDYLEAFRVHKN